MTKLQNTLDTSYLLKTEQVTDAVVHKLVNTVKQSAVRQPNIYLRLW